MLIEKTKITLSDKELELVCNTEWILTKHQIIEKIYQLFGEALVSMQDLVSAEKNRLPEILQNSTGKISKGENYHKLPYVMLDYPRIFEKENTLAIRTFFWWGNSFSMHLQLAGEYKNSCKDSLLNHYAFLQQNDYHICVSDDPWQHHFGIDNYLPVKDCSKEDFEAILNRELFVKIGKKISIHQWNETPMFIERTFNEIMMLLKD